MKIIQKDWYRFSFEGKWALVDLTNEWVQFFGKDRWNWITFHIIDIQFEKEEHIDTAFEFEFHIMGFGIRIAWSADFWFRSKKGKEKELAFRAKLDKEIAEFKVKK